MRHAPAPETGRGGALRGASTASRSYSSGQLTANVRDLPQGLRHVTLHVAGREQTVHVAGSTDREAIEAAVRTAPAWRTALKRAISTRCHILQLRDANHRPI